MSVTAINLDLMSVTVNARIEHGSMAAGQSRTAAGSGSGSVLERGFDQTTAAQIAARAGLTERTFFRHFADKREVLFGGSALLQERIVAGVAGAPRQPTAPSTPFPGASTPPPPCSASSAGTWPASARP
jgi:hypothetical protein